MNSSTYCMVNITITHKTCHCTRMAVSLIENWISQRSNNHSINQSITTISAI